MRMKLFFEEKWAESQYFQDSVNAEETAMSLKTVKEEYREED